MATLKPLFNETSIFTPVFARRVVTGLHLLQAYFRLVRTHFILPLTSQKCAFVNLWAPPKTWCRMLDWRDFLEYYPEYEHRLILALADREKPELPLDLLRRIVGYLPPQDRRSALLVCDKWKRAITGEEDLWQDVHFEMSAKLEDCPRQPKRKPDPSVKLKSDPSVKLEPDPSVLARDRGKSSSLSSIHITLHSNITTSTRIDKKQFRSSLSPLDFDELPHLVIHRVTAKHFVNVILPLAESLKPSRLSLSTFSDPSDIASLLKSVQKLRQRFEFVDIVEIHASETGDSSFDSMPQHTYLSVMPDSRVRPLTKRDAHKEKSCYDIISLRIPEHLKFDVKTDEIKRLDLCATRNLIVEGGRWRIDSLVNAPVLESLRLSHVWELVCDDKPANSVTPSLPKLAYLELSYLYDRQPEWRSLANLLLTLLGPSMEAVKIAFPVWQLAGTSSFEEEAQMVNDAWRTQIRKTTRLSEIHLYHFMPSTFSTIIENVQTKNSLKVLVCEPREGDSAPQWRISKLPETFRLSIVPENFPSLQRLHIRGKLVDCDDNNRWINKWREAGIHTSTTRGIRTDNEGRLILNSLFSPLGDGEGPPIMAFQIPDYPPAPAYFQSTDTLKNSTLFATLDPVTISNDGLVKTPFRDLVSTLTPEGAHHVVLHDVTNRSFYEILVPLAGDLNVERLTLYTAGTTSEAVTLFWRLRRIRQEFSKIGQIGVYTSSSVRALLRSPKEVLLTMRESISLAGPIPVESQAQQNSFSLYLSPEDFLHGFADYSWPGILGPQDLDIHKSRRIEAEGGSWNLIPPVNSSPLESLCLKNTWCLDCQYRLSDNKSPKFPKLAFLELSFLHDFQPTWASLANALRTLLVPSIEVIKIAFPIGKFKINLKFDEEERLVDDAWQAQIRQTTRLKEIYIYHFIPSTFCAICENPESRSSVERIVYDGETFRGRLPSDLCTALVPDNLPNLRYLDLSKTSFPHTLDCTTTRNWHSAWKKALKDSFKPPLNWWEPDA